MPLISAGDFERGALKSKINFDFGSRSAVGDKAALNMLHALSKAIIASKEARQYPDLITFGYFCRQASIKRELEQVSQIEKASGWGTALHIAPSNIPMNFAFSFAMGFLSGNSNIVRVPTKTHRQMLLFIEIFDDVLMANEFQVFKSKVAFVQTDYNSPELVKLVANVQALIVWGGDRTVVQFRSMEKQVSCNEVYFPNRVSSAIFDAMSICKANVGELKKLFQGFFNDTYLVDQNACSSPSQLFWLGDSASTEMARERFWKEFSSFLQTKYQLEPKLKIDKILAAMHYLSEFGEPQNITLHCDNIYTVRDYKSDIGHLRYGFFSEFVIEDTALIADLIRSNEQTLSVYGIDLEMLGQSLREQGVFLDRIVSVGKALDMNMKWDGKNILNILSKHTAIG